MARDYRKASLVVPAAALPIHLPASCLPARVTAGDIASDVVSPAFLSIRLRNMADPEK